MGQIVKLKARTANTPPWEISDSLNYEIEDYELPYHSQCLQKDLLYIKLKFEGKLYTYEFSTKIDSIWINSSEMKLKFNYW